MLTLSSFHQSTTNNYVDLYETLKLPIYSEFMSLTGSFELSILLNQIAFSSKKELTLYDIRRMTLSDKTSQTLRKKLDTLFELGLINKRRDLLYGKYLYSAAPEIYPNDNTLLALVDGVDLRENPCYLTASILNKFRQLALENIEDVTISANELRKLLGTEKSTSLVRLILKRLVNKGYLKEELVGVIYSYKVNVQKFLNVLNPHEVEEQAKSLATLFVAYRNSVSDDTTIQKESSFKTSFKRILLDGFNANVIKHLIAFIGINRDQYHFIKTPSHLRKKYDELNNLSTLRLSKRKASRFIYKLMHAMVNVPISEIKADIVLEPINNVCETNDIAAWQEASNFVQQKENMLFKWYEVQAAGTRDIDFDDFKSQAMLIFYESIKKGKDEHKISWVKFRLKDFMYRHRSTNGENKNTSKSNTIIKFCADDISNMLNFLNVANETEEEHSYNVEIKDMLNKLDDLSGKILSDYHGLEGIEYTFEEIGSRHNISTSTAHNYYHKAIKFLRNEKAPPNFK